MVLISTIGYSAIENASEKYNAHIAILPNLDLSMTSWAEEGPVFWTAGLKIYFYDEVWKDDEPI